MRRAFRAAWLLAVAALAVAAVNHQQIAAEVADTERAFAKLTAASNIRDGFLAYFAEDSISFDPDPGPAVPRLRAQPPDDSLLLDWHPVLTGVSRAGDLAYNAGPSSFTERKTGKRLGQGYFMSMWRRQPDGKWKVELDIGARVPDDHTPPAWSVAPLSPYVAEKAAGPADVDSLTQTEERFRTAVADKGLAAAYAHSLSEHEVRLHRRLKSPLVTRAAADEYLRAEQARGTLSWRPAAAHIARSADLGYTYGAYSIAAAGAAPLEQGSYTHVWKRAANGDWKLVLDVKVPNPPPQP